MTAVHGKGMLLNVASAAVARIEEATLQINHNPAESSGAGDDKSYLPGQADYTLSGTCVWDAADAAQEDLEDGGVIAATYFPGGSGKNWSGSAMCIESFEVTSSKDDVVRASFVVKGPMTRAAS